MELPFGQESEKGLSLVQSSPARFDGDRDKTSEQSPCGSVGREVLARTGFGTRNQRPQRLGFVRHEEIHSRIDPEI
jgi:hypothetical protein